MFLLLGNLSCMKMKWGRRINIAHSWKLSLENRWKRVNKKQGLHVWCFMSIKCLNKKYVSWKESPTAKSLTFALYLKHREFAQVYLPVALINRVYSRNWPVRAQWAPFYNLRGGALFQERGPFWNILGNWEGLDSSNCRIPGVWLVKWRLSSLANSDLPCFFFSISVTDRKSVV